MDRGLRFRSARSVLATLLLLLSPLGLRADSVFDARGFNPFRAPTSELPYEHVDPLTGNLLLTFTDLVLPGDAGFDLRVQRTYNSKLYPDYHDGQRTPPEDSWAGIGWTLHMGRIPNPGVWMEPYPAIEMPDGSQHQLYSHADGSGRFVTRDHWVYDRSGVLPVLRLPNGVEYTFGKDLTLSLGGPFLYVTLITDPFGNRITVQYMTPPTYPADGIASITQTVGGTSRTVTFQATTDSVKRLSTMKYSSRTWTYPATSYGSTHSYLTGMTPPTGPGWSFTYWGSSTSLPLPHGLKSMTTPFGGVISYEYQTIEFYLGTTYPRRSPALSKRTTSGTDLTQGVWTYSYAQGPSENQTVIASPCNTVTHTFDGVGALTTPGGLWRVGLPTRRQVKESSTVLETENLVWQPSVPVSNDFETIGFNQDAGIFIPLQQTRTVTRGTRSYQTAYTYRTTNYNDYGRPWTVGEVGDLSRTRTLTYKYGFSPRYIVDKLDTETLQQGSESFTSSFVYGSSTGFETSQTIRGITTTFTPDARGNVATETDAHGHQRSYQYEWGTLKRIQTPLYNPLRTRVINSDGTVQSETTASGFTTSFAYDNLMRLTTTTPHQGNATVTQYALLSAGLRYNRTTRGSSLLDTYLDGFGRPSSTVNSVGVKTDMAYDACGRRTYESLPYETSNTGYTYAYDGLDRMRSKANPGGTAVSYTPSPSNGIDITIVDERGKTTVQDWSAFGEPTDGRLAGIMDADGKAWTYTYNALGNLTRVHPPEGPDRTWVYYGTEAGGKPGLLKTETHPESGTIGYTYDGAGRMWKRDDGLFGTTTFGYDSDDRLTSVDRPGGDSHDKTFGWDDRDNRTLLENRYVKSTFAYDGVNRLQSRTDVVNPCYPATSCATRTFVTSYSNYDGNDNVRQVDYPSGTTVTYLYDSENRITSVGKPGAAGSFASSFAYHPSGGIGSYLAGNQLTHTTTYNARHAVETINAGGVLGLTYTYDNALNPQTISESTRIGMNQALTYDNLNRLWTATGPWGSETFDYYAPGNRKTKTLGGTTTYNYNSSTGRLDSATGVEAATYCYDSNGNTTFGGPGSCTTQFTHTPDNMIFSAASATGTTSYRYDADDVRTVKTFDATKNYYIHGLGGQLLSELVEDGMGLRGVRDYVYSGARLLASVKWAASLPAPVITAPSSGQSFPFTGITLSWMPVVGATGYDLEVSDASTGAIKFTGTLAGNSATSTLVALPGGSLRFAVRACSGAFDAGHCGAFASVVFTVQPAGPAGAPTITAPLNGANLTASIQTLAWTTITANPALPKMTYDVLLEDVARGTIALQISVPHPANSTIFTLRSSVQYRLRVRGCQASCGPYSPAITFAVSLAPVPTNAPTMSGCTVTGGNSLTCTWGAVANADAYEIQVVQPPPAGPGGGALTVASRRVSFPAVTLPVPAGAAVVFVAACTGDGCGPNAQKNVYPSGPNPSSPNLGSPMAGTVVAGPSVFFSWNRIPGDTGTNTTYQLYVQDLSRQTAALNTFTPRNVNYCQAYFRAEGTRYDALVISNQGGAQVIGPAVGFNVGGQSMPAPTMVSPVVGGTVAQGNVQVEWSPVPGATLYEYFVAVTGESVATARGVTTGLLAQVPLAAVAGVPTSYSAIARACPSGATCVPGGSSGWGDWSNVAGTGTDTFTVTP